MDVGKTCRTTLNSCVYYYYHSYGVIFVVFSQFFVGVGNFVCGSVDYPTRSSNVIMKGINLSNARLNVPFLIIKNTKYHSSPIHQEATTNKKLVLAKRCDLNHVEVLEDKNP
ncbi:hypothetical protein HKD37_14G040130 [Glycine soja]